MPANYFNFCLLSGLCLNKYKHYWFWHNPALCKGALLALAQTRTVPRRTTGTSIAQISILPFFIIWGIASRDAKKAKGRGAYTCKITYLRLCIVLMKWGVWGVHQCYQTPGMPYLMMLPRVQKDFQLHLPIEPILKHYK